mmetsp:Transcript_16064/g.29445  ORF Transcript_16064/g.29445 Transcript_16064/m.29445 type:complete len:447 (+) Transcript_16064:725-2065(+)
MDLDDLSCGICLNQFNAETNLPRMLPCGHTYCHDCLSRLFQQEEVPKCPEDDEVISASAPEGLPKNFALLRLVQKQVKGSNDPTMCKDHKKKLEYICMEEKVKICANCALVGVHRGHDIKLQEDIMNEIAIRAECLLDMLQIIERSQSFVLDEPIKIKLDSLYDVYLRRKDKLTSELDAKFVSYHAKLDEMQATAKHELGNCFQEIESHFVNIRDMPKLIDSQASGWKQNAKDKLQGMSAKSDDPSYIAFEMLESNANELLEQGEKILMELEGMKDLPINPLEQVVSKLQVKYSDLSVMFSISYEASDVATNSSINEDKFEFALDAVKLHTLEEADFSGVGDLGNLAEKIAPHLVDNSCLKTLKLSNCGLSDASAVQIFRALQVNNTLKSLDISQNTLGEVALEELVELLEVNSTLRELDIKEANLTEEWKEKLTGFTNRFRRITV